MTEREFWILVRRALLMVVRAIEVRFQLPGFDLTQLVESERVSIAR